MRLNNNDRIITDSDILMSDGQKSLSDVIDSVQEDISKLSSNVKWIYKYGGVGSGTGGGGGSSQSFSIFAQLNNIQLKDQQIVLSGKGNYPLSIRINNPNGMSYNVQYTYTTVSSTGNTVTVSQTQILSIDNNYQFNTVLNLNNNATLSITATNGNDTKQVMCDYVTTSYDFTTSVVDNNGTLLNNEIFIETAKANGVNVKLSYVISVSATISYKYTFNGKTTEGQITDKTNSILFPVDPELFADENTGLYSGQFTINILPEGQEQIVQEYTQSFSLIPSNLYLLIIPQTGVIYNQETEDPYLFTPGYITFDYRVYEGISQNRTYNVTIQLNGVDTDSLTVVERQLYSTKMFAITPGMNTITVKVNRATTYTKTYYFYVDESTINSDWFDNPEEWIQNYYRINETTSSFEQYKGDLYIEQSVNSDTIRFSDLTIPSTTANSLVNTHIALGIQYSSINTDGVTIFNFYNKDSGSSAIAYINQESFTRQGVQADWYIKKQTDIDKDDVSKYHLLQIYSQYVKKIGNEHYYEISIYIDGVLEDVFGQLTNSPLLVTDFEISNVNCCINLLDIDYNVVEESTSTNCDYDVYKFFLAYKSHILREDVGNDLILLTYLSDFKVGLNGRVTTSYATINNIANNISTPVMVMTCDNRQNNDDIMSQIEKNYGEDGSGLGSDLNFRVNIAWSPGNSGVNDLQLPDGYNTVLFRASLQGSSTKLYRVKNFTLAIENSDDSEQADVYLYSPNFEDGNTDTFLPETEFTLKADVVDSSHSNNTSCGKFVNTVCRKFSNDINEDGYYKGYIKNCLEGFPFLMFLCVIEKDENEQDITTYYYLGVYNFNLGRQSYYNLGYKDLSVFGNERQSHLVNAGSSFTFYKITQSQNVLREGLGVAEIQGGSNYFDFSQYDPTIIFQQTLSGGYTDNTYMFGDIVYGSNSTLDQLQNTISQFVQRVALSGGYLFDYLKKKRGDYSEGYHAEKVVDGQKTGESLNQVPDYTKQYKRQMNSTGGWEYVLKETTRQGTMNDLQELIIPDIDQNKQQYLNFQAVSEYYTICMVLGLVDSVMKNLNIKTWNNTTWYPAFYDMDTCLGINNQGNPINYFAFSDYWDSKITKTAGNTDYPTDAQIYRDFSPESLGENGFDVPTNYLFTVAKYAKLIFNDSESESAIYTSVYPQELYAKWRSNTVNNETGEGILRNADAFMDNFFSNNLGSICPALISYNYRSKYLSLGADTQSLTWVDTDYNKFNGTRINQVRDWLEGRLHILDVYFNLNSSFINAIQYLDDDGVWQPLVQGAPVVDITYSTQTYDLQSNTDVIILRDIFSATGGAGVQLSGNVSIQIRCPEFSPLQIYNANGSIRKNYILGGDNNQQIEFQTTGVQGVKLGGSQAWTYLSDINWLSTSTLSITSDKLESINGSTGSISSIQLTMPNLKTVALNSSQYKALLSMSGQSNYPNLSSIDISNSKMSLNLDSLNIKNLNISNISNNQATIQVINCPMLETIGHSNMQLQSLTLIGLVGNLKNFTLSGCSITNINISCSETGGTLTIQNDDAVEFITVEGFETVVINNCRKLQRVTVNSGDIPVKTLKITSCPNAALAVTSTDSYQAGKVTIADSSISTVNFNGCSGITDIELPNNCYIEPYGCNGLSNLQTLTGNNIYVDRYSFYNCSKYALKDKTGGYSDIHVKPDVTSIAYIFGSTAVDFDAVRHFINNSIPEENSITSVDSAFYLCTNILFGYDELKTYDSSDNLIKFEKLNKVTSANNMFHRTGMHAYHKSFYLMGSTSGCSFYCTFAGSAALQDDTYTYLPLDVFEDSITKITHLNFTCNGSIPVFVFLDESLEKIPTSTEIQLKDIFNPNGQSPIKLRSLIGVSTENTINLQDTFTAQWLQFEELNNFFGGTTGQSHSYKNYDKLLYNLPKIKSVTESLKKSAIEDQTCNLMTLFNWDVFLQNADASPFYSMRTDLLDNCHDATNEFTINKYISADDYVALCNKIINSSTIQNISFLFYNCDIIGNLSEFSFGNIDSVNNNITTAINTWCNCRNLNQKGDSTANYLMLSDRFFKRLPNIANVAGAFQKCKFGRPISFDFFGKRYLDNTKQQVWVKVGEEYKEAMLYSYDYRRDIINTTAMFRDCEWNTDCRQYDPTRYVIDKTKVMYDDEEHQTYYTRTLISTEPIEYQYIEHTVEQPTEITDAQNLNGGYIESFAFTSNNSRMTNPTLVGDKDKLIIPPDFFYCLSSDTTQQQSNGVQKTFQCKDALQGIIPKNIFKNNKRTRVNYLFNNQVIIPNLVKTFNEDDYDINVYVHYPSGYTESTVLNDAFNSIPIVLQDSTIGGKTTYNYSLMLLSDSIPSSVTTLSDAFDVINPNYSTISTSLTTFLNNMKYSIIGEYDDYGNITLGFNISRFSQLNQDRMYYTPALNFMYGNLFTSDFDAAYARLESQTSYILKCDALNSSVMPTDRISSIITLPKASNNMNNLAPRDDNYTINSSQIVDSVNSKNYYISAGWNVKD